MINFITKQLTHLNENINEKIKDWSTKKKIAVICGVIFVFCCVYGAIAGISGDILSKSASNDYVKLTHEELVQLDCKDLLNKNVGIRKEFCGEFHESDPCWYMVVIDKNDLYNVNANGKYCASFRNFDEICSVSIYSCSQKFHQIAKRSYDGAVIFKGELSPAVGDRGPSFQDITFIRFNDPGMNW